jgi:hypothetical protein
MAKPRGRPRKKSSNAELNRLRAQWRRASRKYYYGKETKSRRGN